jgi:hypothetical protein
VVVGDHPPRQLLVLPAGATKGPVALRGAHHSGPPV